MSSTQAGYKSLFPSTQSLPTDIVAVDDGYARVKIIGLPPSYAKMMGQGPKRFLVNSSVGSGGGMASLSDDKMTSWRADGEEFTVADAIDAEDTRFDGFHWSPMNRVLVAHALAASGWSGETIERLYLGLPLRHYYNAAAEKTAFIGRKIANLQKAVEPVAGKLQAPFYKNIKVLPQSMAGYIDHFIDFAGNGRSSAKTTAAVIDIGGRTTDIAYIRESKNIDMKRSVTRNIGVLDVHALIDEGLRDRFARTDAAEKHLLDHALRNKTFFHRGVDKDVSDIVTAAVKKIEGDLARAVSSAVGQLDSIELVLLIGGGADVFLGLRDLIPHAEIPEDPAFANARGLWKYAAYYDEK
ncbi:MAG TPA: ParM/StbA family protein [Acidocella sp.]|nr:ParM/StbA family protein [Acidocella sp.]